MKAIHEAKGIGSGKKEKKEKPDKVKENNKPEKVKSNNGKSKGN